MNKETRQKETKERLAQALRDNLKRRKQQTQQTHQTEANRTRPHSGTCETVKSGVQNPKLE